MNEETKSGIIQNSTQKNDNHNQENNSKSEMLKGSAWMTAGSIFSRILGAIYIIPWAIWFGNNYLQANALFTKGYNVYAIFLMISTAGIPSAVGKQVAHYNSLNEYGVGRQLFKKSLVVMFGFGLMSAIILWGISPLISQGDTRLIPVYRSLALTLLLIPVMSLTRGFFQGYLDMEPFAISQFVEQLARIIFMLASAYFILNVQHGSYKTAVVYSTFAAFIGAVAGLLVLVYYFFKRRSKLNSLLASSNNELEVKDSKLIKEIIYQSIPFILITSTTTIYNLLDQYTFPDVMSLFTNLSMAKINELYALFAGNANKLIMISISIAASMADTAIPLLSKAVTKGNKKDVATAIVDALELFFFIMLPASLGMAAVAKPLYILFYPYDYTGIYVLAFSAYIALFIGLFMVLGALLQGIYQNKVAIKYAFYGLVVKFIIQMPLIIMLGVYGPLASTAIGLTVSNILCFRFLYYKYDLQVNELQKNVNLMMIYSMIMFVIVLILSFGLSHFMNVHSKFQALIILVITAGLGGYVYAYLTLKSRLIDDVLGESKSDGLRRILRVK